MATPQAEIDEPRTLYVCRHLLNAEDLIEWAEEQGFESTLEPEDMHVTIAYSRAKLRWAEVPEEPQKEIRIPAGAGWRYVKPLGSEGAIVMCFDSQQLRERWEEICAAGGQWDYEQYIPHVTITYQANGLEVSGIRPYDGELIFGPEEFSEVGENAEIREQMLKALYTSSVETPDAQNGNFTMTGKITKFDEERRVVYGWASVIEKDGKVVVDTQGDRISEDELVSAAQEFVTAYRAGDVMHDEEKASDLVESVVFTRDLQKALGIDLGKVGWFVGFKVKDEATWKRVKKGELAAFSIGGDAIREKAAA